MVQCLNMDYCIVHGKTHAVRVFRVFTLVCFSSLRLLHVLPTDIDVLFGDTRQKLSSSMVHDI